MSTDNCSSIGLTDIFKQALSRLWNYRLKSGIHCISKNTTYGKIMMLVHLNSFLRMRKAIWCILLILFWCAVILFRSLYIASRRSVSFLHRFNYIQVIDPLLLCWAENGGLWVYLRLAIIEFFYHCFSSSFSLGLQFVQLNDSKFLKVYNVMSLKFSDPQVRDLLHFKNNFACIALDCNH